MQATAAFNDLMDASKLIADWAPEDAPTPHKKSKAPLDDLPVQGKIIIKRIFCIGQNIRLLDTRMRRQFLIRTPEGLVQNNVELRVELPLGNGVMEPAAAILQTVIRATARDAVGNHDALQSIAEHQNGVSVKAFS